jgi:hypothetical protein
MQIKERCKGLWWESLKTGDNLENLDVDRKITLIRISTK